MSSSPVSGYALRLAHRLRVRTEESRPFESLADLLGLTARTLARRDTWSGPTAAAMFLLGEASAGEVRALAEQLLHEQERESRSVLSLLSAEVADAPRGMTFAQALDRPIVWVYWATSARAGPDETLRLARDEGIVCRPLLENAGEVHDYLYAIRRGDTVLLAHDGEPQAWLEIVEGDEPPVGLWSGAHPALARGGSFPGVNLLPRVFRFIRSDGVLGTLLGGENHQYRRFDGKLARQKGLPFFSALAVRGVQQETAKLPSRGAFDGRGRGQRSRMTRYRRSPEAAEP